MHTPREIAPVPPEKLAYPNASLTNLNAARLRVKQALVQVVGQFEDFDQDLDLQVRSVGHGIAVPGVWRDFPDKEFQTDPLPLFMDASRLTHSGCVVGYPELDNELKI